MWKLFSEVSSHYKSWMQKYQLCNSTVSFIHSLIHSVWVYWITYGQETEDTASSKIKVIKRKTAILSGIPEESETGDEETVHKSSFSLSAQTNSVTSFWDNGLTPKDISIQSKPEQANHYWFLRQLWRTCDLTSLMILLSPREEQLSDQINMRLFWYHGTRQF